MDITALLHTPTGADPRAGKASPRDDAGNDFTRLLQAAGRADAQPAVKGLARLRPDQAPILLEPRVERSDDLLAELPRTAHATPRDDAEAPRADAGKAHRTEDDKTRRHDARTADAVPAPATGVPALPTPVVTANAGTATNPAASDSASDPERPSLAGAGGRHVARHAAIDPARDSAEQASAAHAATVHADKPRFSAGAHPSSTPLPAADPTSSTSAADRTTAPIPGITPAAAAPASPAHVTATPTPAAPPPAMLQAAVGTPAWQQELGQQLIRLGRHGEHQVRLQLHPAELGTLQVSLHFNHDSAQAQFLAAHAQARDAVQQALPQLREAFAHHGIALGEATVGQQQQHTGGQDRPSGSGAFTGESGSDIEPITAGVHPPARTAPIPLHASGVDLYA